MSLVCHQQRLKTLPLFVDYGQRGAKLEWAACQRIHRTHKLGAPVRMDLHGFGTVIATGLTTRRLDVKEFAFVPGRNLLFLLAGAAYAFQNGAAAVAIGLLNEKTHIFPDQTSAFLAAAQNLFVEILGTSIQLVAPLIRLDKPEVIRAARDLGIRGTYSCHSGDRKPCGRCIACREILSARKGG